MVSAKKGNGKGKRGNPKVQDIQNVEDLDLLIERMSAENKALEKILEEVQKRMKKKSNQV